MLTSRVAFGILIVGWGLVRCAAPRQQLSPGGDGRPLEEVSLARDYYPGPDTLILEVRGTGVLPDKEEEK